MTHASRASMIRPAWTPATIAMMVIGFMLFWPLGLAMLAYILWGDRLDEFKNDVNRATDNMTSSFSCRGRRHKRAHSFSRSGNVAFDDWREAEMTRLEEERRKLDEMRREFDEYLRELRRAKDADEFDEFMAAKKPKASRMPKNKSSDTKSVPDS